VECSTAEWGYDSKFVGYDLGRADPSDVRDGLAVVEIALRPCPPAIVEQELMRLKILTKSQALDAKEVAFQTALYTQQLGAYPEDVVVDALRCWCDRDKWWPAWAELQELIDARMLRRTALRDALRRG
jgi:hypothetical protein